MHIYQQKQFPGSTAATSIFRLHVRPFLNHPRVKKVVELFRTLGDVWEFRKGNQDGNVHAEVFPSSYLGCDMIVNEASHQGCLEVMWLLECTIVLDGRAPSASLPDARYAKQKKYTLIAFNDLLDPHSHISTTASPSHAF